MRLFSCSGWVCLFLSFVSATLTDSDDLQFQFEDFSPEEEAATGWADGEPEESEEDLSSGELSSTKRRELFSQINRTLETLKTDPPLSASLSSAALHDDLDCLVQALGSIPDLAAQVAEISTLMTSVFVAGEMNSPLAFFASQAGGSHIRTNSKNLDNRKVVIAQISALLKEIATIILPQ
jgi:hypothetical protein